MYAHVVGEGVKVGTVCRLPSQGVSQRLGKVFRIKSGPSLIWMISQIMEKKR
jgi:hypothetical protein